MARNKEINDNELLKLIEHFYRVEHNGNLKALKLPAIADYIAAHGYPNYKVTTLRRNESARKYIESLQETHRLKLDQLFTYKTLDADNFLAQNRTHAALVKALTHLDAYYKTIVDIALKIRDENDKLKDEVKSLKKTIKHLEDSAKETSSKPDVPSESIQELKAENKRLTDIVNEYVYDAVAEELLAKDKELTNATTNIDPNKMDKKIIAPDFNVRTEKSKSTASRSGSDTLKAFAKL